MSGLDVDLLGQAGQGDAEKRARGCSRPVRLRGSTSLVETATGEVREVYGSSQELDGITYVRCGNRRAAVCPSCSQEYKGDAWHILACGLMGGKGVPDSVASRPCTFVTLTAPSFGAVHGVRRKGVCRPRRDRPVCPHGMARWCNRRHDENDDCVGEPLCVDCYDYLAHVVWQFHANELWRRFLITLQRHLAKACGLTAEELRARVKVSFSKVVEFQARGAVHFHAPMRLDGPDGPDGAPSDLPLSAADLEAAVRVAAGQVSVTSTPAGVPVARSGGPARGGLPRLRALRTVARVHRVAVGRGDRAPGQARRSDATPPRGRAQRDRSGSRDHLRHAEDPPAPIGADPPVAGRRADRAGRGEAARRPGVHLVAWGSAAQPQLPQSSVRSGGRGDRRTAADAARPAAHRREPGRAATRPQP